MGKNAGEAFHNAAALVETSLSAREVLARMQDVENRLGRVRSLRWGPRPVDLDLLFRDSDVIADDVLTLPHPGLPYRAFVVLPLAEIDRDRIHPVSGESVAQMEWALCRPTLELVVVPGGSVDTAIINERARPYLHQTFGDRCRLLTPSDSATTPPFATVQFQDNGPIAEAPHSDAVRNVFLPRAPYVTDAPGVPQALVDFCTGAILPILAE